MEPDQEQDSLDLSKYLEENATELVDSEGNITYELKLTKSVKNVFVNILRAFHSQPLVDEENENRN